MQKGTTIDDLLIRHLSQFTAMTAEDRALIAETTGGPLRAALPKRDLIRQGEEPRGIYLILSGWGCRYKMLQDGRRQILAVLIPGDLCDIDSHLMHRMDHAVGTLTNVEYREIAQDRIEAAMTQSSVVARALRWQAMAAATTQREWIVSLGLRNAFERLGHLFCELYFRLRAVGLVAGNGYEIPMTQVELGEATGLTSVHVNRTLRDMRERGLIRLHGRFLEIPDIDALRSAVLFSPQHMQWEGNDSRDGRLRLEPNIG